jgi:hypothetical protein
MSLIQPLPEGPLDIVGDIHGEIVALRDLLSKLGYDQTGNHPQGRRLVFVGDLCDRGPDSPAVIQAVGEMVKRGNARVVLGNHELNLLRDDAKDGSGWYFEKRAETDKKHYAPFARLEGAARKGVQDFLAGLPIALERSDLRVVHAAWTAEEIGKVRGVPLGGVAEYFRRWHDESEAGMNTSGLRKLHLEETAAFEAQMEDKGAAMPFLEATAEHDVASQMNNPFKVLTSGVEKKAGKQFFSSNKWRFTERVRWWDEYQEETPVVVGHYWRSIRPIDRNSIGKGGPDLFDGVESHAWHGKHKNVFCVDFSVGKRWEERRDQHQGESKFRLAALRWPERTLVFDRGDGMPTVS